MLQMFRQNPFYLLLMLAGCGAVYGYWSWHVDPYLLGTVESRVLPVGAREGGRILEVMVEVGGQVVADQPLVRLEVSDLMAEREMLLGHLTSLRTTVSRDRERLALEQRLLQVRVLQQYADIQADASELDALTEEIQRLRDAEDAGLGHGRDLAALLIQHAGLRRRVAAQAGIPGPPLVPVADSSEEDSGDGVIASLLAERMRELHETQHALLLIQQRLERRMVRAPCAGVVVEVMAGQGSTVEAYVPILAVADARVSYVEIYVPETQDTQAEVGQLVEVYSRRSASLSATGRVCLVYPGFSLMPERLWLRGQMLWARKLRAELAPGHPLLPGESVRVRLLERRPAREQSSASAAVDHGHGDRSADTGSNGAPAPDSLSVQQERTGASPHGA